MKHYIRKYAILNLSAKLAVMVISALLIAIFPKLLTKEFEDGSITSYSINYLQVPMGYLCNVIIAIYMYKEMKRINLFSPLTLILTCFASITGTIIFLILLFENQLTNEKQIN